MRQVNVVKTKIERRMAEISLPGSMSDDEVAALTKIVNAVYDVAEDGMWKVKGFRTTEKEVKGLIDASRLLVVRMDGKVVGCTKLDVVNEKTGEFGMLAVDQACRSQGIGRKLVDAAEDWAQKQGFTVMQLEILSPKSWKHSSKEFLKGWYSRMGYTPQTTASFADDFPQLAPMLATECQLTIWTKPLIREER